MALAMAACGGRSLGDRDAAHTDGATADGGTGSDDGAERIPCYSDAGSPQCLSDRPYCCGTSVAAYCEREPEEHPWDEQWWFCNEQPQPGAVEPNDCITLMDHVYHFERCPNELPYCCDYYAGLDENPDGLPSCADHDLYGYPCEGPPEAE